jgi:hypothetical protein
MLPVNDDIGKSEPRRSAHCSRPAAIAFTLIAAVCDDADRDWSALQHGPCSPVESHRLRQSLSEIRQGQTAAGSGRIIPLNPRAISVLTFWSGSFPFVSLTTTSSLPRKSASIAETAI